MHILFLESISDTCRRKLDTLQDAEIVYTNRKEVTEDQLQNAEVIIGNPSIEQIQHCDSLKWLQLGSAGANTYASLSRDFLLTNASGAYGTAISEYILACTLMGLKHFPEYLFQQKECLWNNLGAIRTLSDCTVLILGMGDIGQSYARRVKALGASKVIGVRRTLRDLPDGFDEQYTLDTMQAALEKSDVIVAALPETEETKHILNKERLSATKHNSVLINVGRGSVLDEDALVTLCNADHFASVFLDVFEHEPLPKNSPLWDTKHLYVTPHIAGTYNAKITKEIAEDIFFTNIQHYLHNEPLEHVVNRELGY